MKNRRAFVLTLIAGLVTLAVIITPVIAEEFFGSVSNVDVEGRKLTIISKDGVEVVFTTTDSTELVNNQGVTIGLENIAKGVARAKDAGKKWANAKVTHESKVVSKIVFPASTKQGAN